MQDFLCFLFLCGIGFSILILSDGAFRVAYLAFPKFRDRVDTELAKYEKWDNE